VSIRDETHTRLKAAADGRGCAVTALLEEILDPALSKLEKGRSGHNGAGQ
jgi:hypothetical protein